MKILIGSLVGFGIVLIIVWLYTTYILIKNNNTFKQRVKVVEAIHDYFQSKKGIEEIDVSEIDYMCNSLESYDDTLNRYFDWGCKNIVPPDVYEKIEPYIKDD